MYGSFGVNKDTWIDRIMIDKNYQGKGFGKQAMKQLIEIVSKEYDNLFIGSFCSIGFYEFPAKRNTLFSWVCLVR